MTSGDDRILEEMFEEYQQERSRLTELHQQMKDISVTAVSPRQEVSVTFSHTAGLTDIKFSSNGYRRLAPQELSDLVMTTVREAREKARAQAAAVIGPVLPDGWDAQEVVAGRIGLDNLLPSDGPRLPAVVREHLDRRS